MKNYPTNKNIDKWHRMKAEVNRIIRNNIRKNDIVYGSAAINQNILPHLRTSVSDWDVYVNEPKKRSREAERELDRALKFNAYETKRAQSPDTYRLKSRISGESAIDFTKKPNHVPSKRVGQISYAKADYLRKQKEETLRKKMPVFREPKDMHQLARLKLSQRKIKGVSLW